MKDIFERYLIKIDKSINDVYFMCNGNIINEELKLEEINKKDEEIKILVYDLKNEDIGNKEIIKYSKDIICPECKDICLIDIKDYKIILNNCNNKHKKENILLDEYNNLQKINELDIICNLCKTNKSEIYKNQLFICCKCKINICPLCKSKHNKEHKLIDYEFKNYICNIHGEKYIEFCKECNINLCDQCVMEHNKHNKNHNYEHLTKLLNIEENNINEMRIKIDNLKDEINNIINIFNKIIDNMEIYYNIYNNIINIYKLNKSHEIIMNINNLYNFNEIIIKDINKIINENSIENKFKSLYNIYNKMTTTNDFIIKYKIGKEDKIRLFGDKFVENNKNNFQMIIKNEHYKLDSFYDVKNEKENDILEIKLKQINDVTNLSYMFNKCLDLVEFSDISKMDTKNINNME